MAISVLKTQVNRLLMLCELILYDEEQKLQNEKNSEARGTRTPNRSIWSRARYQLRHSPYLNSRSLEGLNSAYEFVNCNLFFSSETQYTKIWRKKSIVI